MDNTELYRQVTLQEVEIVIQSMDAIKAPGPDGFSGYFYKHYCKIIKGDVVASIKHFFSLLNSSKIVESDICYLDS